MSTQFYFDFIDSVKETISPHLDSVLTMEDSQKTYVSHGLVIFGSLILLNMLPGLFSSNKTYAAVGDTTKTRKTSSKNKKEIPRDLVLICGPVQSGKTSLLNILGTREVRNTVTSITQNKAELIRVNIPEDVSKEVR